jgi:hypothetical protein
MSVDRDTGCPEEKVISKTSYRSRPNVGSVFSTRQLCGPLHITLGFQLKFMDRKIFVLL